MMLDNDTLYRAAGLSAWVAVATLVVAGIALALFFGGAGQVFGPINDVFAAVMLLALILPILALDRLGGGDTTTWLRVVTVAAIAGAILAAVGQLLLVVGVIDLQTSYVTGGIGFTPVVAWIIAVAVLALAGGALPVQVGWLAAASLGLIVVGSIAVAITTGPPAWAAWVAVVLVLAAWLVSLASDFLSRVATA